MTLGRRLTGHAAVLLGGLLLTAVVGGLGMSGLRQDFSVAAAQHERLRMIYQVGFYLRSARLALTLDFPDLPRARLEARRARQAFARDDADREPLRRRAVDALASTVAAMNGPRPSTTDLDAPLGTLNELADAMRQQIADAQAVGDRRVRRAILGLAGVAGAAVVLSVVVGRRQVRAVLGPLATLAAGVRRVAAGEFGPPLPTAGTDAEFAALADDFNAMARQLDAARHALHERVDAATRAAVRSERLAGVGLLAAGVAHEINNPLSIVAARVELLRARTTDPAAHAPLDVVLDETFRCKRIIDRLLMLARGPAGRRTAVRLHTLAEEVVAAVRTMPAATAREWSLDVTPALVCGDDGELRQVLLNLLLNAVQFTPEGGRITVAVRPAGADAELSAADDGRGLDASQLRRLFEPFYSDGPEDRRGTGLGLAISAAIVEAHGGRIEAYSDGVGRGSRFVVRLPRAGPAVDA